MSFIKALMNFLKKFFGGSTNEQKVEEKQLDYTYNPKKMSEGSRAVLVAGHSDSEEYSLLKQVDLNEQAGHTKYIIEVGSCYYKISNANFTQYRKGDWMNPDGGLSKVAKDMLLIHHKEEEKEAILKQIADNEAAGNKNYKITVEGGYYNVKNNVVIATL